MGLTHVTQTGEILYGTAIRTFVKDASARPKVTDFADLLVIGPSCDGDPEETYAGTLEAIAAVIRDETIAFSDGYAVNPVSVMRKAASPSPETRVHGAKSFLFQDVGYGTKTRAEWELEDASGHVVAKIMRRKPGISDMRVWVDDATNFAGVGIKINVKERGKNVVVADNIGPAIYVDGPAGATLTTTRGLHTIPGKASEDRMLQLECKVAGQQKLLLNLLSADSYTIAQVAALIAGIDGGAVWDAYVAPGVDPSLPASYLDLYSSEDVSSLTLLTANVGSLIFALYRSPLVYAEKAAAALDTYYTLPVTNDDYTEPTTPGAFPTPSVSDWITAIGRAEDALERSLHVILCTTDQTVCRYLASRIAYHRDLGDKTNWRAFVGHPDTSQYFTNLDMIKEDRRRINEYDVMFVGASEFYDNETGIPDEVMRSCMYAAAGAAGVRVGNYRMSITNKQFSCNGLVRDLTPLERVRGPECLVANRVMFLENRDDGTVRWQRGLVSYSGGTKSSECNEFPGWVKWYLRAYFNANYEWIFGEIVDGQTMLPALKASIRGALDSLSTGPTPILTANPDNPTDEPAYTINSISFDENAIALDIDVGAVDEALWMGININFRVQRQTLRS